MNFQSHISLRFSHSLILVSVMVYNNNDGNDDGYNDDGNDNDGYGIQSFTSARSDVSMRLCFHLHLYLTFNK